MARTGGRGARGPIALLAALLAVVVLVGVALAWSGTGAGSVDEPDQPSAAARPSSGASSASATPTATRSATPVRDRGDRSSSAPLVTFVGDSWTYGTGATGEVGYAHLTGRLLGWEHRVLGVGGSGYVRGGEGNVPYRDRIRPALAGNPDVVVVQGSINERDTPVPVLAAAVEDTLERLVGAAGSDTVVVVLGASHVPGAEDARIDRINDVLRAQTARLDLPFVDVAAENWSDPEDPSIWADATHVNDAGARRIAGRLVPLLQAVVGR